MRDQPPRLGLLEMAIPPIDLSSLFNRKLIAAYIQKLNSNADRIGRA
jgi:hypothetical protein